MQTFWPPAYWDCPHSSQGHSSLLRYSVIAWVGSGGIPSDTITNGEDVLGASRHKLSGNNKLAVFVTTLGSLARRVVEHPANEVKFKPVTPSTSEQTHWVQLRVTPPRPFHHWASR